MLVSSSPGRPKPNVVIVIVVQVSSVAHDVIVAVHIGPSHRFPPQNVREVPAESVVDKGIFQQGREHKKYTAALEEETH